LPEGDETGLAQGSQVLRQRRARELMWREDLAGRSLTIAEQCQEDPSPFGMCQRAED